VRSDKSAQLVLDPRHSPRVSPRAAARAREALSQSSKTARPTACVFTSVHPPFDIRIFHKECKSLLAAGYDVVLLARSPEDCVVDGIRLRAFPKAKNRLERVTRTVWRVYREALKQGADVYHFHDPELIPIGLLLRLRGKSVIYDVHEDVPRCLPYKPYWPRWIGASVAHVVELLENSACRFFSGIVAATPGIAARFAHLNPRTIIVNNYPLMSELSLMPHRPWRTRDMAVAYVGSSVSVSRCAIEMVQAMGLLPPDLQASLILAGPFLPESLRERLAADPGWSRVHACGFLDRAGVTGVLSRARVGFVLQHPEPNAMAGKPIKMFEYMAAGIPVISADFPLWRQIVDGARCGLCVNPLNPQEIAQAVQYLLTHPEEAEAMGRRGRQAVEEHFNWDHEEIKLLNLYCDLVQPHSARNAFVNDIAAAGGERAV
jgi:glycosyltransferase involved in cell wall biosynthesis